MRRVLCNIQQVFGRPAAFLAPLREAGFECSLVVEGPLGYGRSVRRQHL